MKKRVQKQVAFGMLVAAAFLSCIGVVYGEMTVLLKDGQKVTVPVDKQDVVSITFSDGGSRPATAATWDFETGALDGWQKTGTAFNTQPTYGDNPTARHRGQPSRHQGNYWIGGYENRHRPSDPPGQIQGDGPQGTLTSAPFTIASPVISFLIGGGCDPNTERAELIVNGRVVLRATGKCTETLERHLWDVTPYMGQAAQIRLVDASSGGWGHINFDDVRFE